eukprot:gnl/MRDRNA2_/MRDRNA2_122374_c0_seq1.p1 gnl/MRDRNA2_/MRDRNA2_122374_c0~~gnl/MRDRNA2_/MRDRNA2_122374_c0_seq1.p1  ORF type:complete len:344 (-),score=61.29 gnl/MRDRNA2_/MRDRNA2_122374_c0_seq1:76-1107(-)
MQLMEWALFAVLNAVHPYISQGSLAVPQLHNKSNTSSTVAKANVTIPVVAHQSRKAKIAKKEEPFEIGEPIVIGDEPVKVKGCQTPLCVGTVDTIVLVDVSGSVGQNGIDKLKQMLQKFPYHFQGPSDERPRGGQFLALMSYGKGYKIHTQWTDDKEAFKEAANSLELHWGSGDLGAGLTMAHQLLRYAREHSYHNVLVITDGGSTSRQKALQAAELVGQTGGVIYMVVVEEFNGPGPKYDECFEVVQAAGQYPAEDYMMKVDHYADLLKEDVIGQMVYSLCPQVLNLMSVGSKMVRTIIDGNRTSKTQIEKPLRNLRKFQIGNSKHDGLSSGLQKAPRQIAL